MSSKRPVRLFGTGASMPRRSALALLGGGLVTATVACGSSDDAPAKTPASKKPSPSPSGKAPTRVGADLVIWTSEAASPAITPIAEAFGKKNGITVAVQIVAADLAANAITANAAKNGPDVLTLPNDFIGGALQNGAVSALPLTADALVAYDPAAVAAVTRDGQVYALPYGTENIALVRNLDAVPDAPATMDDLVASGQAAVDAGKVERVLSLPVGQAGDAYHMYPLYTSGGGFLFGTDAEGLYDPKDLGLGMPGSIEAATKIGALGESGSKVLSQSVDSTNSIAQFLDGKAAYLVTGPWALADIRKSGLRYEISAIPPFAGGGPARPFKAAQAFWVMSNAKNPTFAQEFVTVTMNTPEAITQMYQADPRPPARPDVLAAVSAKDPDMARLAEAGKDGVALPDFAFMAGVWPPTSQAFASVVGGADPAATMGKTASTVSAVIAKA